MENTLEYQVKIGDKTWEVVHIFGDEALARLLKVSRGTVIRWRNAGKITGKPVGKKKDGKPAAWIYDWESIKLELKYGPNGEKIKPVK